MEIKEKFIKGIKLRNEKKFSEAISCLNDLIRDHFSNSESYKFYIILGGIYQELKLHDEAINSYTSCLLKKPNSEIASLGKYVSYVELGQFDNALSEIIAFLNVYPANLYLDTLEELVLEIHKGNICEQSTIKSLQSIFIKNNIKN